MKNNYFCFILLSLGLSACALFERSESSGYQNYGETTPSSVQEYYVQKREKNWVDAKEELGIVKSTELTEAQAAAIQYRVELNRLEQNIPSQVDKKQYYSLKPYFKSDLERIYFLKLPNRESRERWAQAKGITTDEKAFDPSTNYLIENNDVSKNMSRNAVRQSWGEPDFVDVAGDPIYGNERWRYNKLVSTEEGYKSESRIIYFEAGRVVGWETLN